MRLVSDMEDGAGENAGGIRVWGSGPLDGENWEVGQGFFDVWWWVLGWGIVKRSNVWRRKRGEGESGCQVSKSARR